MRWGATLVTAPTVEPVCLATAKGHLRVDQLSDDNLITGLIVAARVWAEAFTRRAIMTQTWDLFLDRFPFQENAAGTEAIRVPYPLLQSVTSVKYTDISGVLQTVDPATYIVDKASEPARISLAYLKFWPTYQQIANSIQIRFVAGYGDTADKVPQTIKQAMLLCIGHWYQNRETISGAAMSEVPLAAKSLLWSERVAL